MSSINNSIEEGATFKVVERIFLGGTQEMYLCLEYSGEEWLFKHAILKNKPHVKQPFRAYINEAGYKVQNLVDPDSAIFCKPYEVNGMFGSIQKRIEIMPFNLDFSNKEITNQLLREWVTDYLLFNYDTNAGNFIMGRDGTLRGVDKEQSLRFIREADVKPSLDYAPDRNTTPIYNTMFKQYRNGAIDLDLESVFKYIDRVESVTDEEYQGIFKIYAYEVKKGNLVYVDELLSKIVLRKQNIRENVVEFFNSMTLVRNGQEEFSSEDSKKLG